MRQLSTKLHKPCCVFRGSAGSPETRILNFQIDLFVHGKSSRSEEVREKCLVMKKEAGLKNLMSRAGSQQVSPSCISQQPSWAGAQPAGAPGRARTLLGEPGRSTPLVRAAWPARGSLRPRGMVSEALESVARADSPAWPDLPRRLAYVPYPFWGSPFPPRQWTQ